MAGVEPAQTTRVRPAPEPPTPAPPRLRPDRVDEVLASLRASPVDDSVRAVLSAPRGVPLRMVGASGEHGALAMVLARAERLLEEAGAPDLLDVATVRQAREDLRRARGQGGAPLRAAMERLEVVGWRLAFGVSRVLGGPLVAADAPERLPGDVLADPQGWLDRLEPADPAYPVLVEGLRRYRLLAGAVGQGGTEFGTGRRWRALEPGDASPRIGAIRARLREVGFPAPPVGSPERFDAPLGAALRDFQRRHALPASGLPDRATLEAMAVPLAERVAAIEEALRHVRANPARLHPDRIQVNIAAFALRLVVGDRVEARHRVVVGANTWARDPFEERAGHLNRTPTLASRVTEVVLNPSWHVPRRIKELELDERARRYSGVYDDFELYVGADGVERAVQLPGPGNALGRVKFVFAGGGGVYLHDTPKKAFFDRVERALSHGCVRVEDALDLARRILAVDRHPLGWSGAASILRSGREAAVTLYRPLPIFLEYVLVDAGPDGQVRFHRDVYGWGPAVSAGELPPRPPPPLTRRDPARR